RVTFLVLRDRAGLAQIVLDEPLELVPETVRDVEGHAVRTAASPSGSRFSNPPGACSDADTHPDPARPGYSNSFDLLFRGFEVVTAGSGSPLRRLPSGAR